MEHGSSIKRYDGKGKDISVDETNSGSSTPEELQTQIQTIPLIHKLYIGLKWKTQV
jgi:hypothetical protein